MVYPAPMRDDLSFSVPLRVRFSETDAAGVANNGAYLAWLEIGRIEYLRWLGHSYAEVHGGGIDMVVVEANVRYLRALRFDDQFRVRCGCTRVSGASFTFDYVLERDGIVCTEASTRHACLDRTTMRPVRVPEWLRRAVGLGP